MNGNALYQLHGVSKCYGSRLILSIDDLSIQRGEIFALVGPSGAGKSTLLRLLNFLEPLSSGKIHFEESEFSNHNEVPLAQRRRVTMVFQNSMLLNRSVWDNVSYGLEIRGKVTKADKGRIEEVLQLLGLGPLSRVNARTLSGGEAQRVALARAVVIKPDVLLLDEPTANLDPYNIGIIEQTIRNLNRESGMTLVLVTHNVFQARRIASRVALLLEGRIVEVSDTAKFFNSPLDERTSAFVNGEMVY